MITTNHPTGPQLLADDGLSAAASMIVGLTRADLHRLPSLFAGRKAAEATFATERGCSSVDVLCIDMGGHLKLRRFGPRGGVKLVFDFGKPVSDATGCAVLAA